METQKYPVVPGHEIAGIVKEVGSNVQRFKVGDHMGVGTHVNSCRDCEYCNDRFNGVGVDGTIAKGGYSSHIVVHEGYCFNIPENYPLASAAPLLCAGITVYASMVRHKMNQPGNSLGVIGLGGLGGSSKMEQEEGVCVLQVITCQSEVILRKKLPRTMPL
ncbi:unnamed protein product [Prunus armeniaca]